VILAMFVDVFDSIFLEVESVASYLSYVCEAFVGHPGHNP
jgi:hypothetical protein